MERSDQIIEELLQDAPPTPRRGFSVGSVVLIMGFVLVAIVVGMQLAWQNQTQPTSGPAPDFSLTTFDSDTFHLSEQRGKIVVINFWASWCVECRAEAPILQSVWERYRDQGVVLVGVAYLDSDQGSRAYIQEFGITYPNGPDMGTRISDAYRITGVPETFVVDQKGNVVETIIGPIREGQLDAILDRILWS
jgi:cytochrome c biogenesis protein CcmG/thiol:disulfide interchange protein DsbE